MNANLVSAAVSILVLIAVGAVGALVRSVNERTKNIEKHAQITHQLVNDAMEKIKAKVKRLEEQVESLGGPAAPPDELLASEDDI